MLFSLLSVEIRTRADEVFENSLPIATIRLGVFSLLQHSLSFNKLDKTFQSMTGRVAPSVIYLEIPLPWESSVS